MFRVIVASEARSSLGVRFSWCVFIGLLSASCAGIKPAYLADLQGGKEVAGIALDDLGGGDLTDFFLNQLSHDRRIFSEYRIESIGRNRYLSLIGFEEGDIENLHLHYAVDPQESNPQVETVVAKPVETRALAEERARELGLEIRSLAYVFTGDKQTWSKRFPPVSGIYATNEPATFVMVQEGRLTALILLRREDRFFALHSEWLRSWQELRAEVEGLVALGNAKAAEALLATIQPLPEIEALRGRVLGLTRRQTTVLIEDHIEASAAACKDLGCRVALLCQFDRYVADQGENAVLRQTTALVGFASRLAFELEAAAERVKTDEARSMILAGSARRLRHDALLASKPRFAGRLCRTAQIVLSNLAQPSAFAERLRIWRSLKPVEQAEHFHAFVHEPFGPLDLAARLREIALPREKMKITLQRILESELLKDPVNSHRVALHLWLNLSRPQGALYFDVAMNRLEGATTVRHAHPACDRLLTFLTPEKMKLDNLEAWCTARSYRQITERLFAFGLERGRTEQTVMAEWLAEELALAGFAHGPRSLADHLGRAAAQHLRTSFQWLETPLFEQQLKSAALVGDLLKERQRVWSISELSVVRAGVFRSSEGGLPMMAGLAGALQDLLDERVRSAPDPSLKKTLLQSAQQIERLLEESVTTAPNERHWLADVRSLVAELLPALSAAEARSTTWHRLSFMEQLALALVTGEGVPQERLRELLERLAHERYQSGVEQRWATSLLYSKIAENLDEADLSAELVLSRARDNLLRSISFSLGGAFPKGALVKRFEQLPMKQKIGGGFNIAGSPRFEVRRVEILSQKEILPPDPPYPVTRPKWARWNRTMEDHRRLSKAYREVVVHLGDRLGEYSSTPLQEPTQPKTALGANSLSHALTRHIAAHARYRQSIRLQRSRGFYEAHERARDKLKKKEPKNEAATSVAVPGAPELRSEQAIQFVFEDTRGAAPDPAGAAKRFVDALLSHRVEEYLKRNNGSAYDMELERRLARHLFGAEEVLLIDFEPSVLNADSIPRRPKR